MDRGLEGLTGTLARTISFPYWFLQGWLSKLWSPFGYPKYWVPYYNKDPKKNPNIDNHPQGFQAGPSEGQSFDEQWVFFRTQEALESKKTLDRQSPKPLNSQTLILNPKP